ncbi:MAG: TatD family hydrolase [bacterium]
MIDTHAHLADERFDPDREQVIERAASAGPAAKIVCVLSDFKKRNVEVFEELLEKDFIYGAAGIHPHDASRAGENQDTLKEILSHPKIAALGEIGLDYHYMNSPKEIQIKVFEEQMETAAERKLPVIIHCRDAFADCSAVLEKAKYSKAVMHCFSGTEDEMKFYLDLGFYISFAGPVTFPKAVMLRELVKKVPAGRLLLETDCPYLAPQPVRGKRNEPAFIKYVYETVADARGVTVKELQKIVLKNSRTVFGI